MFNFLFRLKRQQLANKRRFVLPQILNLSAINRSIKVIYFYKNENKIKIEYDKNEIRLYGNISDHKLVKITLDKFLKQLAKEHFTPILEQAAKELGVSFNRLSIRGQKTRWGSCSSKGNINLNFKLLFVSPEQMNYVIYHELVHLLHFNHSKLFWNTLANYIPDAKKIAYQMRRIRLDSLY